MIGGLGDSPGRFAYPRAIDADDHSLWVVDKTARIQRLDPESGRPLAIYRMPNFDNGMPVGLTVAPGPERHDALYIADTHYHRVAIFRVPPIDERPGSVDVEPAEPRFIATFGEYGEGPGQFIYTTDVDVLVDDRGDVERVYVGEYGGNDRISVFDGSHDFLFSFGSLGASESAEHIQFDRPQAIAIDAYLDELIVVDKNNHRIGRFTLDGSLVRWIGAPTPDIGETAGAEAGRFRYPNGLLLLGDGSAMVVEYGGNRVQRIDLESGRTLGSWGEPGYGPGQLKTPWAIAMMDRTVFVLDSGNNRIVGTPAPRSLR